MKSWKKHLCSLLALSAGSALLCSAAPAVPNTSGSPAAGTKNASKALKVGVVSFKKCVEESKIGKFEQANFEGLKKQMESLLADKEKTLNDMGSKLNDPDYLDSLSPEAETELKRKFRALSQEMQQQQNQYMQTLQQTNMKVIQKLQDQVLKATESVAKNDQLDLVLNDEAAFYISPDLDVSAKIISILDQDYDKNPPQAKETAAPKAG